MAKSKGTITRQPPLATASTTPATQAPAVSANAEIASVHALAALALLLLPFGTVVLTDLLPANPRQILHWTLPAVTVIQAFTILATQAKHGLAAKSTGKKSKSSGPKNLSTIILGLVLTALLTPLLHIIYVLFGAPVTSAVPETFLLSAHTAILSLFPLLCTFSLDSDTWANVVSLNVPVTPLYASVVGTILGAWLGAIPIPLDWDREWQKWPVTIIIGAYVGNSVGRLVGIIFTSQSTKKTL
ncbi:glycosylphosphatidylinositol anchor biosynthesis 11 [Lipomyces japonicus]|uniref:glycosylphosphatidylinositol anchor biosynthesis 11 n=1 Tax=Lipomyces japonicus TaxID=56871 RepID=UPI0034CDA90B